MYLFNPDNDLALAHFGLNYTPPASARKMAQDLALLPLWYGGDESVVAEGRLNGEYLSQLKSLFPIKSELLAFHEIPDYQQETFKPWGWNPALRKRLLGVGVREGELPSLADLERLREYSNRKNAVKMLGALKAFNPHFCGESHFFTDLAELRAYLSSSDGDKLLKMPLSGSGKGIVRIVGAITEKQQDWCRRVIQQQGGVVAEPVFDKVQDWAMEFEMKDGKARFVGYSLFSAAASGTYVGNELLPENEMESRLCELVDLEIIEALKSALEKELSANFSLFFGFLGVDMMFCRNADGKFSLHPCVEINVRMNMGLVAHCFRKRFVNPVSKGVFRIAYFKREDEALSFVAKMREKYPLSFVDGKIRSGFLPLTATDGDTNYVAFAIIG
ncbi:MAG: hypothetical protein LBS52_05320 [Dysgonamonadaceae bacterium]|jgi:hypothetical protein|nr:hypothetical protein [Dysgonamonadaceae bacterium]